MKRSLFLLALTIGMVSSVLGQNPDDVPVEGNLGRPLNPAELRDERWYYSIEEAMANPEAVYKLSLSGKKLKTLPPEVAQFTNLQILNLSDCRLKSLPEEIRALKHLEMLSLYDNKLKTLPEGMRELKHLEVLYLGKNKLTQIPIWIGGMGHLRRLDISQNRITPLELVHIRRMMPKVDVTY